MVPHDIVLRAMSLADVFLRTTLYDGDSIAVREGSAYRIAGHCERQRKCDRVEFNLIPPGNQAALEAVSRITPDEEW